MPRDSRRFVERRLFGAGVRPIYERQPSQKYQRDTNYAESLSPGQVLQGYIAECKVTGAAENRAGQAAVYALGPAGLLRT